MTAKEEGGPFAFAFGQDECWPGVAKLIEEAGEVIQVLGKLVTMGGNPVHYSGDNLVDRLEEELGDLQAAIDFTINYNSQLSRRRIIWLAEQKMSIFENWHEGDDK